MPCLGVVQIELQSKGLLESKKQCLDTPITQKRELLGGLKPPHALKGHPGDLGPEG